MADPKGPGVGSSLQVYLAQLETVFAELRGRAGGLGAPITVAAEVAALHS